MIIPCPRRKIFYRGMPSVFFGCQKFSMLALCMDFRLASWPICFWLSVCFCICVWYALGFACMVQYLPSANRMARVWHAFATVTGLRGCVGCCTRASFERGLSCIPRLALEVRCWSYRYKVACFRQIHSWGCIAGLCFSCLFTDSPVKTVYLVILHIVVGCYICSLSDCVISDRERTEVIVYVRYEV